MKKGMLIFGIIDLVLGGLSSYTFINTEKAKNAGNVTDSPFNFENITKRKETPKDGSTPKDYDILDNIEMASYYLYTNRNFKAVTTGAVETSAGVNVVQDVLNTRIIDSSYMFQEAISYSGMVKVANQKFYTNEKTLLRFGTANSLTDVTWTDAVSPVSYDYIYEKYGFVPEQLTAYYYSADTILPTSTKEVVGDKTILHVDLSEEAGVNARREVVTVGGGVDYPSYKTIHNDITLDKDWKVLQIDTIESYTFKKNIGLGVIEALCNSSLSETFEYNVSVDQELVDYYKDYFNAEIGGEVNTETEKTTLDYLQNMLSLFTKKTSFDVSLKYKQYELPLKITISLDEGTNVFIKILDKYYIAYTNNQIYSQLDGLNFLIGQELFDSLMNLVSSVSSGQDFDFMNLLPSDFIDSMTLKHDAGNVVINIPLEILGIKVNANMVFDKESMGLKNINGLITYGEHEFEINVTEASEYVELSEVEYQDFTGLKFIFDSLKKILKSDTYALKTNYVYDDLKFEVNAYITSKLEIKGDIIISRISNPDINKKISIIYQNQQLYFELGNIKVLLNKDDVSSLINDIMNFIPQDSLSIDINVDEIISGLEYGLSLFKKFELKEKELVLSLNINETDYDISLKEVNGSLKLDVNPLGINMEFSSSDVGFRIPTKKESILSYEDFTKIINLISPMVNHILDKNLKLSGDLKFTYEGKPFIVSLDVSYTELGLVVETNINDAHLRLLITEENMYLDTFYKGADLKLKINNQDVLSSFGSIVSSLQEYFHFYLGDLDFLTDLDVTKEFGVDDVMGLINTLIALDFEDKIEVSVDSSDVFNIEYTDLFNVSIYEELDGNYIDFYYSNFLYTQLKITDEGEVFEFDEDEYLIVENMKDVSKSFPIVSELIDYEGYEFVGSMNLGDIDISIDALLNKELEYYVKVDISHNETMTIIVRGDSNNFSITSDIVNLKGSNNDLMSVLSKLSAVTDTDIGASNVSSILTSIVSTLRRIRFDNDKIIINILDNDITISYADKLLVRAPDLLNLELEIKENKEDIPTVDTSTYKDFSSINELLDSITDVVASLLKDNLNIAFEVIDNKQSGFKKISGNLIYRGISNIQVYASIELEDQTFDITLTKIDKYLYLDLILGDFKAYIKLNGMSLVNTIIGVLPGIMEHLNVESVDITEVIASFIDEGSINNLHFDIGENDTEITYNDITVNLNYLYTLIASIDIEDKYSINVDFASLNNNVALKGSNYLEIEIKDNLTYLVDLVFELMNYEGYEANIRFTLDEIVFEGLMQIDSSFDIYLDLVIKMNGIDNQNIKFYFVDNYLYLKYDDIAFRLSLDDISSMMSDIDSIMAKIKELIALTIEQEESISSAIKYLTDYLKAIRFENHSILASLNFNGDSLDLDLVFNSIKPLVITSNNLELEIEVEEYKEDVVFNETEYLSYEDLNEIIHKVDKVVSFVNSKKGYFDVDGEISLGGSKYSLDASGKFDLSDTSNLGIYIQVVLQNGGRDLLNGEIYFKNHNIYFNIYYNDQIGLNFAISKQDAFRTIDVLLTKLENGPFKDGNYGLNIDLMNMIKSILEMNPDNKINESISDLQETIENIDSSSLSDILGLIKTVLGLEIGKVLKIDVSANKTVSIDYSNSSSIKISDNGEKLLNIDGEVNASNIDLDLSIKLKEFEEINFNTNNVIFMNDVELLAEAIMNSINLRKYDLSGSINMTLLSIFNISIGLNDVLLEVSSKDASVYGYLKLSVGHVPLLSNYSKAVDSVIFFSGNNGPVYLRRKEKNYEYLMYNSEKEFTEHLFDVLIFIGDFKKDLLNSLLEMELDVMYTKGNLMKSYVTSEDRSSYEIEINPKCLANLLDSIKIKFTLSDYFDDRYATSINADISILSGLISGTVKGDFNVNSTRDYDTSINEKTMKA